MSELRQSDLAAGSIQVPRSTPAPQVGFPVPALKRWREVWGAESGLEALGRRVDQLLAARNAAVIPLPTDNTLLSADEPLDQFWKLLRHGVDDDPRHLAKCESTLGRLQPLFERLSWIRFVRLEEALAAELRAGDLIGVALVLRTLIDELGVIQHVVRHSQAPGKAPNIAAAFAYMRFANRHLLPHVEQPTASDMKLQYSDDIKLTPILRQTRKSLNDYVHPNYGSYEVSLQPERSQAGKTILAALVAIYESAQSAGQWPPQDSTSADSRRPRTEANEWRRLVRVTAPAIDQFGRERYGPDGRLDLGRLPERLPGLDTDAEVPRTLGAELRELVRALSPVRQLEHVLVSYPDREPDLGLPGGVSWSVTLPAARVRSHELEVLAEAMSKAGSELDRLAFVAKAIEVTVLATQFKMAVRAHAAARMLNTGSALGAVLMARSLIEHYAVESYLAKEVDKWCDEAAAKGDEQEALHHIEDLEIRVSMFLCGTSGTVERTNSLRQRWVSLTRQDQPFVRLMRAISAAFGEDGWEQDYYAVFSNYVHGAALPSGDLVRPGSLRNERLILYKALQVLIKFLPFDPRGDPSPQAVLAMDRIARIVDLAASDGSLVRAAQTTKLPDALIPLEDVSGSGSETDPFRFRRGLNYFEAFYLFCRQRGLERGFRSYWKGRLEGSGDQVLLKDGSVVFFADAPF